MKKRLRIPRSNAGEWKEPELPKQEPALIGMDLAKPGADATVKITQTGGLVTAVDTMRASIAEMGRRAVGGSMTATQELARRTAQDADRYLIRQNVFLHEIQMEQNHHNNLFDMTTRVGVRVVLTGEGVTSKEGMVHLLEQAIERVQAGAWRWR